MTAAEIPESHPLLRLFPRAMTESTFMTELGIGDPRLVGYVANLLARFVPSQTVWWIRDGDGRRLTEVTAMVAEAESASNAAHRCDCHRHVGDFTLFWTGVYPEALAKFQAVDSLRPPDQLSASREEVVLPGQHTRRRPRGRFATAQRSIRAVLLGSRGCAASGRNSRPNLQGDSSRRASWPERLRFTFTVRNSPRGLLRACGFVAIQTGAGK